MITNKATTETLTLTTSSTSSLDYSVAYADLTTTTLTPGSSEGTITTATTTTILSAPAAATQRQVKFISIKNNGITTNNIYVTKVISATNYVISSTIALLPGELYEYSSDGRWFYYASNGAIKSVNAAAGNTTEVQLNISSALSSSSNLTFDPSTNTLSLNGTDTELNFRSVTNEPAAPAANYVTLFSENISGRNVIATKGPVGAQSPLQNAMFMNNQVFWLPNTTGGTWTGSAPNNSTGVAVNGTLTNKFTAMRKSTFATLVTTPNQQVGTRSDNMFFRGNAPGLGGFFFACRFGLSSWKSTDRLFVGLHSGTSAILTVDPSTTVNFVGFAMDTGDSVITFMHNNAAGVATKDTIASQPTVATNQGYDCYIYAAPNDTVVYWRIDDCNTGLMIAQGSTSTDIPVNTVALCAAAVIGNGPGNIVAGDATLGLNKIYIETDR